MLFEKELSRSDLLDIELHLELRTRPEHTYDPTSMLLQGWRY